MQVPRLLFRLSHTVRSTDDPQEPLPKTLAADEDIVQEWDGIQMPAENWCSSEPPGITLREMKHSFPSGNRVLSLLVLESAAPRRFAGSGWEDDMGRIVTTGSPPEGRSLIERMELTVLGEDV